MQADRLRRTALAVAVLTAVGAIAASSGAASPTSQTLATNSTPSLNGDGGTSTGPTGASDPSGASGASGATADTSISGASGASGATGATGTSSTVTSSSSGSSSPSGATGGASSTTAVVGASGATGATAATGTSTATPGPFAPPVIVGSLAQPQTGVDAQHPSRHSAHGSAGSASGSSGPTAPSPSLFAAANPLAGVLPGSWDDPFIVDGGVQVPQFYVQSFHVPAFLLPIYQAAGAAYDIPWQTLAAINEVETDYGTDLDNSTAGAIGWMQFLPQTWKRYGVDASASGARDPYNAADAIFAAARFLAAAGGTHNLPAAIFAYNHSHAYVQSVLLRAELLSGEPSALINSVSELAEGDFPIQLRYHASYQPATASTDTADAVTAKTPSGASGAAPSPSAVGQAAAADAEQAPAADIFASSDAAVVSAQDGTVVAIGDSRKLGRFVVVRNAFGDRFTYANLGSVSPWYPVPKPPRPSSKLLSTAAPAALAPGPRPTAPATAGAHRSGGASNALFRAARSAAATSSGPTVELVDTLDLRSRPSAASLFTPLSVLERAARVTLRHSHRDLLALYFTGAFGLSPSQLELARLRVGAHVLAGTILGRLARTSTSHQPHLVFELRPAGTSQPPIDPRPFLDAWSQLETLELHRDSFNDPVYGPNLHAASVGALLRTSQVDIERIVLQDTRVTLPACERSAIAAGNVDRRLLVSLEVLVLNGIAPSVSGAWCASAAGTHAAPAILKTPNALAITALDGRPITAVASFALKALDALHGSARPALSERNLPGALVIAFAPSHEPEALAAAASFTTGFSLSAARWSQLDARLGQIREPRVPTAVSPAALAVAAKRAAAHVAARRSAG